MMRTVTTIVILFTLFGPERTVTAAPPNVIFLLTDDLGYSDIGCYGARKVKTPHLDRLAAEGVRFTDFHTAASICSPSRAAFLTGAYPQRAGLYMGINPIRDPHWFLGLHPDEITLAEQFKSRGYRTFMVGKWHLGTEPEFSPLGQGFDHYYGMPCNFAHSPNFFDGRELIFAETPLERLTELYTERVTSIIRQDHARPFFLYYAHNYPHTPYKAGKLFRGSSRDGVRGDVIQELDWSVGQMMEALEEMGVADNTIVIFTSDNGPTKNEYAQPLRGTKYVSFEGGHCVPLIVRWPQRISAGRECAAQVHAMDLFPTLSEAIQVPLPNDRVYDGASLMPLLEGDRWQRPATTPFYYYNCENLQAVRSGDWKLHLPRAEEQIPFWDKNKAFCQMDQPVLYDLRNDRAESRDVAADHPEIVERMTAIAQGVREELGEYMARGHGQRATGSVIDRAPIISHAKDWSQVDQAVQAEIVQQRTKRHPDYRSRKRSKR
jgi:arylsulfatase A-like enzyme